MKKLLLILLCLPMIGFGQWSNYYTIDVNQNINADVNVSGTINKNITTIDYGQLARANAEREKNRLSKEIFEDNRDSRIALEVASDPSKAFDYGSKLSLWVGKKEFKKNWPESGITGATFTQVTPHKSLLVDAGSEYSNISEKGIVTEWIGRWPQHNKQNIRILSYNEYLEWEKDTLFKVTNDIPKPKRNKYKSSSDYVRALQKWRKNEDSSERIEPLLSSEALAEMHHLVEGEVNLFEADSVYIHSKKIKRAKVWGVDGFVGTVIVEDKYEYKIIDNYFSYDLAQGNGILFKSQIITRGDKNEISFEDLEGRRYYLKQFNYKYIAAGNLIENATFNNNIFRK